jgi:hypothetical protein
MDELVAPLGGLARCREEPIEGALGGEVDAFVEECRVDLGGRAILEPLGMQHVEDGLPLRGIQGPWRGATGRRDDRRVVSPREALVAVVTGARQTQGLGGWGDPDDRC